MGIDPTTVNAVHGEWMRRIRDCAQLETMSVLFAKSVSELGASGPNRAVVRVQPPKAAQPAVRSTSQRRDTRSEAHSWRAVGSSPKVAGDAEESANSIQPAEHEAPLRAGLVHSLHVQRRARAVRTPSSSSRSSSTDAPSSIVSSRFALSLPSSARLKPSAEWSSRTSPSEGPVRVRCLSKRAPAQPTAAFRHSIRVNDDPPTEGRTADFSTSPSSACSVDVNSVDSGQGSGSGGPTKWKGGSPPLVDQQNGALPSYARVASTLDHVLRIAGTDERVGRELVQKVSIYVQIVRQSSLCGPLLAEEDLRPLLATINDSSSRPPVITDHFLIAVRRLLEQTLLVFVRLIAVYLSECSNSDRLLSIALDHFWKAVHHIVAFCRMRSTVEGTRQLLLRSLAVLCGVPKGCVQAMKGRKLQIGGLDVVLSVLRNGSTVCAVEAAGVLTQLTSPNHPFVRLQKKETDLLMVRLLQLVRRVQKCGGPPALHGRHRQLLAAEFFRRFVALRAQRRFADRAGGPTTGVRERLRHGAGQRLRSSVEWPACSYHGALIAQGAVGFLLEIVKIPSNTPQARPDYCRRVRYKAAVCLGTIASCGAGLKAVHEHDGLRILHRVLEVESSGQAASTPFFLICSSIKQRLESVYRPMESVV
ncbi:Insc-C domain-containing protein [Aphelenchoides fujianensis]|nr:Insc-C domain-containing protein [Aphelenchoides fujianensis]